MPRCDALRPRPSQLSALALSRSLSFSSLSLSLHHLSQSASSYSGSLSSRALPLLRTALWHHHVYMHSLAASAMRVLCRRLRPLRTPLSPLQSTPHATARSAGTRSAFSAHGAGAPRCLPSASMLLRSHHSRALHGTAPRTSPLHVAPTTQAPSLWPPLQLSPPHAPPSTAAPNIMAVSHTATPPGVCRPLPPTKPAPALEAAATGHCPRHPRSTARMPPPASPLGTHAARRAHRSPPHFAGEASSSSGLAVQALSRLRPRCTPRRAPAAAPR